MMAIIGVLAVIPVASLLGWLTLLACVFNKVSEFELMIRQNDQSGWAG